MFACRRGRMCLPAQAADKCIRCRGVWQDDDAAFWQITLGTCLEFKQNAYIALNLTYNTRIDKFLNINAKYYRNKLSNVQFSLSFAIPFRLHCVNLVHKMRPIATDGVTWSVCLSVGHAREPCKNGWTDRDAVLGADSFGSKKQCIRLGQDRTNPFASRGVTNQRGGLLSNYFGHLFPLPASYVRSS